MIRYFLPILMIYFLIGCASTKTNHSTVSEANFNKSKIKYFIDLNKDGIYELASDTSTIIFPIKDVKSFNKSIAVGVEFPADARRRGVDGTVIIQVFINEKGSATKVEVKKGIDYTCDAAAKKAVSEVVKANGILFPMIVDNVAVNSKIEISVNFKADSRQMNSSSTSFNMSQNSRDLYNNRGL
ncbi:energy transducer TonB [Sediminitomix flava]|uniref:TonB family protein n=1 Tax=Sediminitomix flava TaxID=379075 RepID=A0A315ZGB6_SEDFL|nr:energy transducer TonB [Sediminitomix flava]PWJ44636.1 TonB family protein [Sediminitomix flava]